MVQDPVFPNVQYIVQKTGIIQTVVGGVVQPTPFFDARSRLNPNGEKFLFCLVFSPGYAKNRFAYISYVDGNVQHRIERLTRSAGNPLQIDPASGFPIMTMPNSIDHWGGTLQFGPDGYLYCATGDGSGGNDPLNNAQNPNSYHGKMIRIDVNQDGFPADPNKNYAIPPDNPFLDGIPVSALPEIWAFGFRNPWKWTFDSPSRGGSGAMIIGDVGQEGFEEVDYAAMGVGGQNFGWRQREGAHNTSLDGTPAFLPQTDPIHEYARGSAASITGGYVYRGHRMSADYRGRYFFADFIRGTVWSMRVDGGVATDLIDHTAELGVGAGLVTSIDIDAEGELYFVDFNGSVRKMVQRALTGTVTLQNYFGPPATVVVDVRAVGTLTALESHVVTLDAGGAFVVGTNLPDGNYDIAIKGPHWLRQSLFNKAIGPSGASGLNVSLANGDVNGDNTVSLGDFSALRLAFGSTPSSGNWNPNADLNGDGAVSLGDFSILRTNFGMTGGP